MKQDLHASGSTKIPGGDYGKVRASGSLKVEGNLRCDSLHGSGSVKVGRDLECSGDIESSGTLKVEGKLLGGQLESSGSTKVGGEAKLKCARFSGSFTCEGDVDCETLECSGGVKIDGNLRVGKGDFPGSCKVQGAIYATKLRTAGYLCAGRDVEAEKFVSSGMLALHGLLNAEEIEIRVGADCKVADIGGSTVRVLRPRGGLFSFDGDSCLHVKSIEGDRIELESTRAVVVRGKNVVIGKACEIGRVEYSETLTVNGGIIGEQVKV